jgi:hypothetical protein
MVSRHRVEREAVESALAHSEGHGDGEYELRFPSVRVIVRRPIIEPDGPALGTPVALSSTQIRVPLDRPATGPTTIDYYTLERSLANVESFSQVAQGIGIFPFDDSGLSSATSYDYRANATDTTGRTSVWGYATGTTDTVSSAPAATYTILANGANNTRRTYDGSTTSGFNGANWVTAGGVTRRPQAGDIIEFAAGTHGVTRFSNINTGTDENRITIRGPLDGVAVIRRATPRSGDFVFDFTNCQYVTISGRSTSASANYECGIKVMYAASAVAGTGTANKDAPSCWVKYNANPKYLTLEYVEIDGGYVWSSADVPNGSGYAYEGIGIQGHNNSDVAGSGQWNENHLYSNLYIHNTQGEGMYIGPNYALNIRPCRNMEIAYCRVEDCGGGGMQIKCCWEGENSMHHNVVKRCGQTAPTPQRTAIAGNQSTFSAYNNWIEDEAGSDVTVNTGGGNPHGLQSYVLNGPTANTTVFGYYGPYSVFECEFYNNVIFGAGTESLATDGQASKGIDVGGDSSLLVLPRPKIYNNTVTDCTGDGIYVGRSASGGFVRNNISVANGGTQVNASPVTSAGGTVSDNTTTGTAASVFVSPSADDYSLISPSSHPAAGTLGTHISARDYDGVTRPQGASADRGAYEA